MQRQKKTHHDYLREATQQAHKQAESNPIFIDMLQGKLSFEQYIFTLKAWRYIITQVAEQANEELSAHYSTSIAWLNADLAENEHDSCPHYTTPCPNMPTAHQAWGGAYVINGAQMGNRVFYKIISTSTHCKKWPTRFYAGHKEQTHAHWQRFCHTLNGVKMNEKQRQEATASAISLFNFVDTVFNEPCFTGEPLRRAL